MTKEEAKFYLDKLLPQWIGLLPTKEGNVLLEASRVAVGVLEQQPKTGRWIWKSGKMIDYCSCSVCKKGQWEIEWNYCPNCGAKMEVKK